MYVSKTMFHTTWWSNKKILEQKIQKEKLLYKFKFHSLEMLYKTA